MWQHPAGNVAGGGKPASQGPPGGAAPGHGENAPENGPQEAAAVGGATLVEPEGGPQEAALGGAAALDEPEDLDVEDREVVEQLNHLLNIFPNIDPGNKQIYTRPLNESIQNIFWASQTAICIKYSEIWIPNIQKLNF